MIPKYKSTTMWMSLLSLIIILLIVVLKLSWAVGIAMALVAIPTVYVTGNKARDYKAVGKANE